jgi:hypothetical protein
MGVSLRSMQRHAHGWGLVGVCGGTLMSFLLPFLSTHPFLWRLVMTVATIGFLAGLALLTWSPLSRFFASVRGRLRHGYEKAALGLTVIAVIVSIGWYFWPSQIRPQCADVPTATKAMKEHSAIFMAESSNWGAPKSDCSDKISIAAMLYFDKALVIYFTEPQRAFFILYDDGNGQSKMVPEGEFCDESWCDPDTPDNKTHFEKLFGKIPPPMRPPYGKIAQFLDRNHDEFKRVGWLRASCTFASDTKDVEDGFIFRKDFEKGFAVGFYPETRDGYGRTIFIYNDNSFTSRIEDDVHRRRCNI